MMKITKRDNIRKNHSRKKRASSNALIVFTREPEEGKTKTRLMPYYSPKQCAEIHRRMLADIGREMRSVNADIIVAYTGGEPEFLKKTFGCDAIFTSQTGTGLGERMQNAIDSALALGYEKAVLIGTDVPELRADSVDKAFKLLDTSDVVIGPTEDGGYYLIGMKSLHEEAFKVEKYGTSTVLEETVASMKTGRLSIGVADSYRDIDNHEDLAAFRERMRKSPDLRKTRRFAAETSDYAFDTASISVIIPVYNEESVIDDLLSQLERFRNDCEIIFVDGGSTDNTAGRIESFVSEGFSEGGESREQPGCKLVRSDKGRGVQLNRGALESTGDILFFLHCDSVLPDDFGREIRRVMAEHEWGCFGVRFPSRNIFMQTNRIISNHRACRRRLPFGDQGIFMDRKLFFDMGMYPEIPVMEDYEMSLRLRKKRIKPGMTKHRIVSSARRYGSSTGDILRTEFCMWNLRRLYRKGIDAGELQNYYKDVR